MRICRRVGIDVSKRKSTIVIISNEREIIEEPFEIIHDIDGFKVLDEKMKTIFINNCCSSKTKSKLFKFM